MHPILDTSEEKFFPRLHLPQCPGARLAERRDIYFGELGMQEYRTGHFGLNE